MHVDPLVTIFKQQCLKEKGREKRKICHRGVAE